MRITINRHHATTADMKQLAASAAAPDHLVATGGLLFRAFVPADRLDIGVLPVIWNGAKNYHYDIKLLAEGRPIVFGGFYPDLTVQILCRPNQGEAFAHEELRIVRDHLSRFCRLFVQHGYPADRAVDWVTAKWLKDSKLFAVAVETVGDVADAGS